MKASSLTKKADWLRASLNFHPLAPSHVTVSGQGCLPGLGTQPMKLDVKKTNPAFKQRQALPLLPNCLPPPDSGKTTPKTSVSKTPLLAGRTHLAWTTAE